MSVPRSRCWRVGHCYAKFYLTRFDPREPKAAQGILQDNQDRHRRETMGMPGESHLWTVL